MIPVYVIEDMTIEMMDALIEKGRVFDVTSKASILSKSTSDGDRDDFWRSGDKYSSDIRQTDCRENNMQG